MFYKASTQKQQAFDFYNSYEGDKVTWPTFYQRVRLGGEESWEEKIKIRAKNVYHRRDCTPRGKRAEEMTWYNGQPEPKAAKTLFRNRLNGGYKKEDAILIGDAWLSVRTEKKSKVGQAPKVYTPQKITQKKLDENDFYIKVTYPKEIARVFRKEYIKMIEEIEWELTYTSEKTEIVEMNNRLDQLHRELQCFNLYNPK